MFVRIKTFDQLADQSAVYACDGVLWNILNNMGEHMSTNRIININKNSDYFPKVDVRFHIAEFMIDKTFRGLFSIYGEKT